MQYKVLAYIHKKNMSKHSVELRTEVESRTQGSRPRPRTQKNFEAKAKDRSSRGQGPRTQTQVFSKKNVLKKIFQAISKKRLQNFFQAKKVFKNFFQAIST